MPNITNERIAFYMHLALHGTLEFSLVGMFG